MSQTALNIYYTDKCLEHKLYPFFSEKPARLEGLKEVFNELSLPVLDVTREASLIELQRAHDTDYINHVKSMGQTSFLGSIFKTIKYKYIQWYTRVSSGSYLAATYAAGSVCEAVEAVMKGDCQRAFCATRPPGHHAGPKRGEGFCIFNNVAIGALHALQNGATKVAVIDFDRHHGNGTQDILSKETKALFISSYQDGCKYSGNVNNATSENSGHSIGIAIPEHSHFETVKKLYLEQAIPALRAFKPDLILISAGFDMHKADPLTNIKLEAEDYHTLTKMFVDVANEICNGRIVSALEGGYDIPALQSCVKNHLQALKQ